MKYRDSSRAEKAKPLSVKNEKGEEILTPFTTLERTQNFAREHPGYGGGLLVECRQILEKLGGGQGISINLGWGDLGLDLETCMLE